MLLEPPATGPFGAHMILRRLKNISIFGQLLDSLYYNLDTAEWQNV